MSQAMFRLGDDERERVLGEAKSTNYSIVNPKTLESVRLPLSLSFPLPLCRD